MTTQPTLERDLDILEMPLNGLAAYWLSVKKLRDTRKGVKIIQEEIERAKEPYIRHLLDVSFSSLSPELVRKLTKVKQRTILKDIRRKLDLIRIALLAISDAENPRVTLIKMNALFPIPPVKENEIMEMAVAMIDRIKRKEVDGTVFGNIDHTIRNEQLMLRLLYYVLLARREGKAACAPMLPHVRSLFFTEGMALLTDKFDDDFIRRRLQIHQREILSDTFQKMDMAMEMCLGIKNKLRYDDVFKIAKSYMPDA